MVKDLGELRKGVVIEALPNTMFRVILEGDNEEDAEIAYLSGRMKRFRIRIIVGDKVEIKIDEYGGKGRIIKRM